MGELIRLSRIEIPQVSRVTVQPIPPSTLSRVNTDALQDLVDGLIEDYGLAAVDRAVKVAKAANGLD